MVLQAGCRGGVAAGQRGGQVLHVTSVWVPIILFGRSDWAKRERQRVFQKVSGIIQRARSLYIWSGFSALMCVLVGCQSSGGSLPMRASPSATIGTEPVLSAPTFSHYQIQPLDTLQITVFDEPELTLKTQVAADGAINYPLLGQVNLSGLGLAEAAKRLTDLLGKDFLVNPSVTVTVEKAGSRRVVILGEVRTPGTVELPADESLTLLDALGRVGGFTEYADGSKVRVTRTENGQRKTFTVNVDRLLKGGDPALNIVLKPNDLISVSRSLF